MRRRNRHRRLRHRLRLRLRHRLRLRLRRRRRRRRHHLLTLSVHLVQQATAAIVKLKETRRAIPVANLTPVKSSIQKLTLRMFVWLNGSNPWE